MTEQVFLTKLQEDVLDTDADITMDMKLDDIVEWDSLSSVSFIAMVNVATGKYWSTRQCRVRRRYVTCTICWVKRSRL